ncbi:MAG TPA: PIG-L family deacetylase, partial [Kofleriaceae bacterium]|nr:PIG-L family deacetylase [Kofleriaceae bacterium]
VLAVGGIMRELAARGTRITIVAVTDGEASHPGSPSLTPSQLVVLRAMERERALARLDLDDARIVRLGYPDGRVSAHRGLASRLGPLVRDASLVLAPWERDGHPDHDATGAAAVFAADLAGAQLMRYPVWAWHWAAPGDDALPWKSVRRIPLAPATRAAKDLAIAEYTSQITRHGRDEPVLPEAVLARFHRPYEVIFV